MCPPVVPVRARPTEAPPPTKARLFSWLPRWHLTPFARSAQLAKNKTERQRSRARFGARVRSLKIRSGTSDTQGRKTNGRRESRGSYARACIGL